MATIDRQKASQSNSTTAFVTALAVNAGLLAAEVGVFLILKTKLWRVYSPRAYLPPPDKRADELPGGLWRWFPALLRSPTKEIIQKNGLDAYMFLRFIKLLVWIFLAFTIVTFLVIIPADAVNIQSTLTGVERISWSNIVDPRDQHRFAAHVIVVYVLTAFVVYMIHREMHHFVQLRHQFLLSPSHSKLAQSRTVLITSIPEELGNEQDIKTFASFVPGGVDRVWLYRDTKTLNELFERRQELCELLEAAESALLKQATKAWRKRVKAHAKAQRKKPRDVEHNPTELAKPEPSIELLQDLVPPHKRPMHRTGLLRLVGTKVDTINWCKEEIAKINVSIAELRKDNSEHKWMDAHPKDIVWNNLDDGALEMKGRYITSWMATVGLIIAWTFPVSFIGTLSNLGELCTDVKWLAWVCDLPDVVRGLIEGVLPPGLLAVLFALLPFILQALAWYECIARYSLISVSVYKRFYFFLLIHGFLVVTLTSGLTNVTQGLAGAGNALAQFVPLILHYVRKWFLGRTPRQAYAVTFMMPAADFGVVLPRLSLLATIAFAYSVLSPLINLLALLSFGMFYIAWKFLFVQVFDQPDETETGGMYFPMAVGNLFVGLYIEHICLAALFFMRAPDEGAGAVVKAIFMLVLLGLTAVAQLFMSNSFDHLIHYLPMSLATKKMAKKFEKEKRRRTGTMLPEDNEEELDLFSRSRIRSVRRRVKKTVEEIKGRSSDDSAKAPLADGAAEMAAVTSLEMLERHMGGELQRQKTNDSTHSQHSNHSNRSNRSDNKPKVVFDAPAPRVTMSDDSDDSDEEAADDHAFDHPSTYQEQAWIWIPKDPLGLSEVLAKDLRSAGVDASDVGAFMDEHGVVEVRRNPPDEEWAGGHDA
ncbi:DUF221 family protein [Coprinopsis cinerea okayama7|uniref:DUF221 family protein n=1 Tax=Coprinopsis cinerea (strain Okayama-7 / 130 / ATCC MYA-4618 / FGSC 9003) TaxID=240176 RepID=A8N6F5_COPC7|nr:DUF221 family protein [Coprinopsis cinerea okayama7\|eukprot:XP_001830422.2 DUF221 family protein [Coprinopsis cinerea okayama7\